MSTQNKRLGNWPLAEEANRALTAKGFETKPGWCWRFVRQVLQKHYGKKVPIPPLGSDAREAAWWYVKQGYAAPNSEQTLPGDLLFKVGNDDGENGHVGIRVPGNLVAENSTVHWRKNGDDARGTRSLSEYGKADIVIRIPPRS